MEKTCKNHAWGGAKPGADLNYNHPPRGGGSKPHVRATQTQDMDCSVGHKNQAGIDHCTSSWPYGFLFRPQNITVRDAPPQWSPLSLLPGCFMVLLTGPEPAASRIAD